MPLRIVVFLAILTIVVAISAGVRGRNLIPPRQAIEMAADAAPAGATGVFDLSVRTIGEQDGNTYLNSEEDYRDQRNLTIAIPRDVAAALQDKNGSAPSSFFKGKHIHVTGEVKRVTIWFFCDDKKTDKYYYQTHVQIFDLGQIEIIP